MTMTVSPPQSAGPGEGTEASGLAAHAARAAPPAVREVPRMADAEPTLLQPHPDPRLVEQADVGLLPIVGEDGRQPWRVYARPFNALEQRPRIAVIVTGLGISFDATESAVRDLPPEVTLAFAPFARNLGDWIDLARSNGHEVLLELPMEPGDYPLSDPGPYGLLTSLTPSENLRRLTWVLSRATGYIGVVSSMGQRFTGESSALQPVLIELKRRGLVYVDTLANPLSAGPRVANGLDMPRAYADRVADATPTREAIAASLRAVEERARTNTAAVVVAQPYPVTLRQIREWIDGLAEKGLVVAPLSAVVNRQDLS